MTTPFTATIYSSPGCMKCKGTALKLRKLGVEVTEKQIHDHPDKVELMESKGWQALPLVELITPDGYHVWHDMSMKNIEATEYLIKEAAA